MNWNDDNLALLRCPVSGEQLHQEGEALVTRQTIPGWGDDRRVKRTSNWKGSGLDPMAPEVFNRLLHAPSRAGDNRLPRGVDVGNPDIFD